MESGDVTLEPIVVLMFSLKTRNNFESTRQEVENLMRRIRSAEQDFKAPGQWTMEGFLYVQEKREYPLSMSRSQHIIKSFISIF